jgi:hypothetical protein
MRSPSGQLRPWVGRAGAATQRNLGDSQGQQGTTNLEVSGRFAAMRWAAKPLDWAFTRQESLVVAVQDGVGTQSVGEVRRGLGASDQIVGDFGFRLRPCNLG